MQATCYALLPTCTSALHVPRQTRHGGHSRCKAELGCTACSVGHCLQPVNNAPELIHIHHTIVIEVHHVKDGLHVVLMDAAAVHIGLRPYESSLCYCLRASCLNHAGIPGRMAIR